MAAGPLLVSEPLQRYRALGWRAIRYGAPRDNCARPSPSACRASTPICSPFPRSIRPAGASTGTRPSKARSRKLSELDDSERQAILSDVHRLHGEITGLADSMDEPQRSTAERNFARLLRHALTAPGEDTLYVVDGKPVMTFWGFSADANLPGVFLASPPVCAAAAVRPQPMPEAVMASAPAIVAAGTRSAWWQWLLLAALLLLLLALLAWLVRPYLPHLEPWLEAEARDRALSLAVRQPVELQKARADTLQQDNENLRLELARLTDEASRRGADCAAAVVVPGGVVVANSNAPIERGAAPDAPAAGPDANMADKDAGKDQPQGKGPDDKNVDKGNMKGPDPRRPQDKSARTRAARTKATTRTQRRPKGRAQAHDRAARGQAEAATSPS